jgi:two-component system cell cycle sensor histidine kinase/response regulator CckA
MVTNAGLRTVLIVDDEQALRSYMVRVLEDEGYAVIQAGNGVEALSVFNREDISTVHLVITDVSMPGMGGKDLAANLARNPASPPVLFVSGSHTRADVSGPLLRKPFLPAQLRTLARQLIQYQDTQRAAS